MWKTSGDVLTTACQEGESISAGAIPPSWSTSGQSPWSPSPSCPFGDTITTDAHSDKRWATCAIPASSSVRSGNSDADAISAESTEWA